MDYAFLKNRARSVAHNDILKRWLTLARTLVSMITV